jgi:ankyrin repeat protein
MLERFPGDLQNRVQTLFGLNEIEAFLEFLKFFVYFSSNYLEQIELRHSQRILHLFINLGPKLMRKIFGLNVLSVKAFLHSLILTAESVGDWGGRALLDADVDRNLYRNHLERLLLAAVKFNHISLVQALVDGGCDVNSTFGRDDEPETFLIYAHSIEVVRILLKAGAHVNNKNYHSRYGIKKLSIYFAIQQQRIDLAKELLDHGATVSGLDRQCLSNAIQYDNDELISFLFDRGATFEGKIDTERSFKTELQCAAFHGATDILGVLLDRQPYIEELYTGQSQWIVLRDAVEEGHLAAAKQLLKAGADVNASSDGCDAQEDDSDFSKIPSTPLLAAVASKDVEMVKLLASYGVNINQVGIGIPGRHRSTALEFAQYMEQYDICHVLVQNGTGVTEMVAAVQQHDKEEIRRLIELGVDSTCILDGDDTGHVDESMLSIFLSVCCGQVNVTSPKLGRSPLAIALKLKNIDLARRIIFSGADLNLPGNGFDSYLGSAVRIIPSFGSREAIHAKINLVNLMIQKGALVNERGKDRTTALGIAIKVGGLDIIKILAEAGADIHLPANRRDFSPLQIALKRLLEEDDHVQERFEIVEYLISVGCDVNSLLIPSKYRLKHGVYLSPLQCAVRSRNLCKPLRFRLLQLLMENGADVNAPAIHDGEYSTPLQVAAEVGDTKTVEMLLKHGADVNAPYNEHTSTENLEYFTALQNAARHGDMEITLILLKHGADVNAPAADRYGATALQTAAWFGDMETVLMLLDHGADIEASPAFCHGCTALQGAASSGNIKLVCMLLERGADVNAPGSMKEGRTALEFATLFGRLDIVQLLLNAEAESLETARHIAVKQDHFIIADILQDHIRTRDMGNFTELE